MERDRLEAEQQIGNLREMISQLRQEISEWKDKASSIDELQMKLQKWISLLKCFKYLGLNIQLINTNCLWNGPASIPHHYLLHIFIGCQLWSGFREKEKVVQLQGEMEQIRQENNDLQTDMVVCRQKEAELLEFTAKLTEKNVCLQSEFRCLEAKVCLSLCNTMEVVFAAIS